MLRAGYHASGGEVKQGAGVRAHGVLLAVQVGQALQHLRRDGCKHILRDAPLLRACARICISPHADIQLLQQHCGLGPNMHADQAYMQTLL